MSGESCRSVTVRDSLSFVRWLGGFLCTNFFVVALLYKTSSFAALLREKKCRGVINGSGFRTSDLFWSLSSINVSNLPLGGD